MHLNPRPATRAQKAETGRSAGVAASREVLPDLDKISVVADPVRITNPLLDVLQVFVQASGAHEELHGWAIMKAAKRSGPTVYGVLDRLEDMGWITGRWEHEHPEPSKPRRRFYRFTSAGTAGARRILAERRPEALQRSRPLRPGWVQILWHGGAA
jgi:PadR family transcriptional regulator, regulatory protein PadR